MSKLSASTFNCPNCGGTNPNAAGTYKCQHCDYRFSHDATATPNWFSHLLDSIAFLKPLPPPENDKELLEKKHVIKSI